MDTKEIQDQALENLENTDVNTQEDSDTADNTSEVDPLQKLQTELEEAKEKYLRLFAEFDNFKKRAAKEKIETRLTAGQDILRDLLPVLDDLDRAEKSVDTATDIEAVKQGFALIKEKLIRNLSVKGLKEMQVLGEVFNPDIHEAVAEFPAPTEDQKGKVFDVTEKGYILNDKIIRFPKVVVSK